MTFILSILSWLWGNKLNVFVFVAGVVVCYWLLGNSTGDIKAALKTVSTDVKIEEKQNEVRNNRPDASGVSKRLRRGDF